MVLTKSLNPNDSFFTWIPPAELTLASTISTMGAGAGAPVAIILSGYLLGSDFDLFPNSLFVDFRLEFRGIINAA